MIRMKENAVTKPQAYPMLRLDSFVQELLANLLTKLPAKFSDFVAVNGVLDARIYLKNTHGFCEWKDGQNVYEAWESSNSGYQQEVESYRVEIDYDRPIYDHYKLDGIILDVGGGVGTVREFLPETAKFISIDPYINAIHEIPSAKKQAYKCLSKHLNFIAATAEFLPFTADSFDWVHMRSMLDHVQVPDLALIEAHRVLHEYGRLLVGLYVEGGKTGQLSPKQKLKRLVKEVLALVGIDKWKDHHIWHPSYKNLIKLIEDNGFLVEDVYWQPHWKDQVCYVCAAKIKINRSPSI